MSGFNVDLGAVPLGVSVSSSPLKKQAFSVHGPSAQVGAPSSETEVLRSGWGTSVSNGSGELVWDHYGIPTPLIADDLVPALTSIFFYFSSDRNAQLKHIHLYDGMSRVRTFETSRGGDFSTTFVDHVNRFCVLHSVQQALAVSLGLQFPLLDQGPYGGATASVLLTAAGAEYEA